MTRLNKEYWNLRWQNQETGWDIGYESPAICQYISQNVPKHSKLLIPGCGNAYEAEYLVAQGYENITILDISPVLVEKIKQKFKQYPQVKVHCQDFFEHKGSYDYIVEQTFFCAIPQEWRPKYAEKTAELLAHQGKIIGLLFAKEFYNQTPPYGGTKAEYEQLFSKHFHLQTIQLCENSIKPRKGAELFIVFVKK
ncbi:methyltransferase domain-containing protein [Capnocytophaga sp. ARDL2]|uniref:methyltransferase domain-containing protein n=1 Tax=Capnocytophaga sp. ARDL2 TaxID=3238809 RepID=UPI003558D559